MPRLTEEQLTAARTVDLFSFLSARSGNELIKTAANEYRTKEHSSLVITPRYWFWNKGGIGGSNAIDYLVKMQGMNFIDAAREVLTSGLSHEPLDMPITPTAGTRTRPEAMRPAFKLPPRSRTNDNVKCYLLSRGISLNTIEYCMSDGTLYEGRFMCNPACVFVGYDEGGEARFAAVRGIDNGIKRDIGGSDKRYSFSLPAQEPQSKTLTVFESPIDALSHMTLSELRGMGDCCHRLSLAGTSHIALEAFLERDRGINRVIFQMDSDEAGITGALRIQERLAGDERFRHINATVSPISECKDMNDFLMRYRLGEEAGDIAVKGGLDSAGRDKREVTDDRRTGLKDHSR
jgi:hypothetical protein